MKFDVVKGVRSLLTDLSLTGIGHSKEMDVVGPNAITPYFAHQVHINKTAT